MNEDIEGRAFKNVSGSPILITDVAMIEIPADGTISLVEYPILVNSTHLRRFVNLNYLIEDPSRGRIPGPPAKVTMQSIQPDRRPLTEAEISGIASKVAEMLGPMISHPVPPPQQRHPIDVPQDVPIGGNPNWDMERADIIDRAIKTIGPVTERFGDLQETGSGEQVDVGKLADGLRGVMERGKESAEDV